MIPESFIQDLLTRVDITDVVSRAVKLKKTGKNMMGCCPFHKEKTPSFSVSPQKQFFKCFGCGVAGNAIKFTMLYEGLNYVEAIKKLAESVGMTVPDDSGAAKRQAKAKTLTDLMQEAASFYRETLAKTSAGINYLKTRQITGETAARFMLGFSPNEWDGLKRVLTESVYVSAALEEKDGCGLVVINDNGRRYDRFRGRLMFPIRNPRGQVIGFGARTLKGDEVPKYINSPETAIYHKGSEIYGLYEAQETIRDVKRAIVCEGYMDVIQLSQAGFRESVAALGTAITSDHVRKLLKIVDRVYFCFDGDGAGQKALRRALEATLPVVTDEQDPRFIVLPAEHDPDSLIKESGKDAFEEAIKKSLSLTDYFVKTVSEGKDLTTPEGRSQFMTEAKPLVASMRSALFLRRQLIGVLAMIAKMSPDDLEQAFGIVIPKPVAKVIREPVKPNWKHKVSSTPFVVPIVSAQGARERLCENMLQNFLSYPKLCVEFSSLIEEEFSGRESDYAKKIIEVWRLVLDTPDNPLPPQVLLERLEGSSYITDYKRLFEKEFLLQTAEEMARTEVEETFKKLEVESLKNEIAALAQQTPVDVEKYHRLMGRLQVLQKKN